MKGIRFGVLGALIALSACGKNESGLPPVTVLTPDGADQRASWFSPDGSRVAFWAPDSAGFRLVVAHADLSEPRTLTTVEPPAPQRPLWSPDGKLLAFTTSSGTDVAVVPADGGEVRRLTDAPGLELPVEWLPGNDRLEYLSTAAGGSLRTSVISVTSGKTVPLVAAPGMAAGYFVGFWSPDGSRLGIDNVVGGSSTIWLADSVGGGQKQLTAEGQEWFAAWSPDGSEIAYVSRRTGTGDIWVLPVDGSKPRQLTRDVRDDEAPSWSRDGKWVAFRSKRGQQTDLWVVPAAGGTELRVTDDAAEESDPQWIGESNRIGFQTTDAASSLWSVNVADGAEHRITADSLRIGEFRVSPDGGEVVYQVRRGGGVNDLEVASVATGTRRVLVAGTSDNRVYNWSPDGKTILFGSNRSGSEDIWSVSAAGGTPRQLTDWTTTEINAEWAADGAAIYFLSDRDAKIADVWKVPAAGGEPRRVTTVGVVLDVRQSSRNKDLFVSVVGNRAGQVVLAKLRPDGTLQNLWERSNAMRISPDGITPGGDSAAVTVTLPDGSMGAYLISTRTGQGRRFLGKGELSGDFSPDGTLHAYGFGSPNRRIWLLNMKDGSRRVLTKSGENIGGYWWTRDGKSIVLAKQMERSRIMTVDVSKLLAGAR